MNKKLFFILPFLLQASFSFSQTMEELKAEQQLKKDSIVAIQVRVDVLQQQIDAFPGWRTGVFGTIGGSISNFNNWFAQGIPNNSSGNIGFTVNGYVNLIQEKFFWRNALTTNLNWVKLDDKDEPTDDNNFKPTIDVFNITSLYGWNLSTKLAASGLVEYRTTLLNNINDPGYLDVGIGMTWTPIPDLIIVINPLNHNFVFSNERVIFESSSGAKLLADYTRQIKNISFKSNFSMFQSYKSSDFSNWTWTNAFGYTLWEMIGFGFDFGLRSSKQEALNYAINTLGDTTATFDSIDNNLQTFWTLGLSYSF
jgi:Protein of unknown function (DUF3078)